MTPLSNQLLIVDDEPEICSLVADIAEEIGFSVEMAHGAEDFRKAYFAFAPTVIFLDLQMPQAGGIELLRELAENRCTAQIVLISDVDVKVLATAKRLGVSLGLNIAGTQKKPFALGELEIALKKLLWIDQSITEEELEKAIAAGQLSVHYQPKVDMKSEPLYRIESAEALVRWEHPELGLLTAGKFIPLAEETGLIAPLTDFVLEEAIKQAGLWQGLGTPMSLAINLSPLILTDLNFPDRISELLGKYEVSGNRLILEVTESGAMADAARTMEILTRFRLKDIGISIDDFGTGYSSMAQLHRMPFSELKIDKSFVMELHSDPEAAIIVRSIIALGHSLGLSICAEGVEDQEALDFLLSEGCDSAQGYFISKPIPPADMIEFISEWKRRQRT